VEAAHLRFRPILMTGFAFVFGVAPMVIASGASGKSQQALGTGVMGGMIAVVVLALIMVPVFFVAVQKLFARRGKKDSVPTGAPPGETADTPHLGWPRRRQSGPPRSTASAPPSKLIAPAAMIRTHAMPTRRHLLAASAAGLVASATSLIPRALAQALKKPAHMIVGFPAGGGTDVIARILADGLRGPYAPTVLVENKPGAAARIAVEYVKNAEPDGSVMLFTPDFPITVYPHSFRSLSYDPLRDFTAVSPAAKSMLTYNIGPAVPESVKTLAEFAQWCKTNPGKA